MISDDLAAACAASRRVCLVPHLGLGDALVLAGLVRHACAAADEVLLFGKRAYAASLRTLFADLPNLRMWFVEEFQDLYAGNFALLSAAVANGFEVVPVGAHGAALGLPGAAAWQHADELWTRAMYKSVRADPDLQYAAFKRPELTPPQTAANDDVLKRALARRPRGARLVVLHDDPSRGFVIDRARLPAGAHVVHVDDFGSCNVFDYVRLLDEADEFHAIDSCFLWLHHFLRLRSSAVCHAYAKRTDVRGLFDDPRGGAVVTSG